MSDTYLVHIQDLIAVDAGQYQDDEVYTWQKPAHGFLVYAHEAIVVGPSPAPILKTKK